MLFYNYGININKYFKIKKYLTIFFRQHHILLEESQCLNQAVLAFSALMQPHDWVRPHFKHVARASNSVPQSQRTRQTALPL